MGFPLTKDQYDIKQNPKLSGLFLITGTQSWCSISQSMDIYNHQANMDMQYIMKLTFCMLISFYETWICIHFDIIPKQWKSLVVVWWYPVTEKTKISYFRKALSWLPWEGLVAYTLSTFIDTSMEATLGWSLVTPWCTQWPLLLTWFNFNLSMDK